MIEKTTEEVPATTMTISGWTIGKDERGFYAEEPNGSSARIVDGVLEVEADTGAGYDTGVANTLTARVPLKVIYALDAGWTKEWETAER